MAKEYGNPNPNPTPTPTPDPTQASELLFLEAKLKEDMEDERNKEAALKAERAQLAALGGGARALTRT